MDLFIPGGFPRNEALPRTTHLAIGAHADDLEIMAYHGIAACYQSPDLWFGGIVVTDGAGSSRCGAFSNLSNEEMATIRKQEQKNAAELGHYSFVSQLGHPSKSIGHQPSGISNEIASLLQETQPEIVFLHNPADKHPTHISVLKQSLHAIRETHALGNWKPKAVYGCEVWRDLDWLADESKVALDCSAFPELSLALIQVFDSQISGGKRYDLAALGRRHANATFSNPRSGDSMDCITWAIDLMPLLDYPGLSLETFMEPHLKHFTENVLASLK